MTQKDYVALAAALARTRPKVEDRERYLLWQGVRGAIADALAADNYRFNRNIFYTATEQD